MEFFQSFLQQITRMQWSDYLDIALVAFLIYKLLPLFFHGSTRRIVLAVAVIVGVAALTDAMKLYTIHYFINQILQVSFLMLVILFQPELRRMLDRLGNVQMAKLFNLTKPTAQMETVISQTVMACESMSRERVGALIVFTRENRLEEYCKTGTTIDAKVSEQLIRNIFFPKAALHDGAMFIREGQIAAAGCVLPLSESNRLSADLGTRHRAGVGMSEMSDAVVIIVSEETGIISAAIGGTLKRPLTLQSLEKLLRQELCAQDEEESAGLLRRRKKLGTESDSHES